MFIMVTVTGKEKGYQIVGRKIYQVGFASVVLDFWVKISSSSFSLI